MEKKLFAFKLADRRAEGTKTKWKARDGVSVANCTLADPVLMEYRDWVNLNNVYVGRDAGIYC